MTKFDWKSLPNEGKAAWLLSHPTISDLTWTELPRAKGESRTEFIRRVLPSEDQVAIRKANALMAKIRKLEDVSGRTEAEAATFLAKAAKLREENGL